MDRVSPPKFPPNNKMTKKEPLDISEWLRKYPVVKPGEAEEMECITLQKASLRPFVRKRVWMKDSSKFKVGEFNLEEALDSRNNNNDYASQKIDESVQKSSRRIVPLTMQSLPNINLVGKS